ncbi:23S rRNA (guanosine(2251)-2'-O)-methyltransferase RlmB [Apibacter raozihei]|uniref:23S rRNA (guanosine(2251)-2'-O)-methyltransferase RlmB n=1 Tax=Apibacter raozihei TaxID=2500547 RepID=UPI000FE3295E|nr:23S rRNA (guanosine(2251)-2'-O)-methyltransferase RlmB [Apibacter raozihei]
MEKDFIFGIHPVMEALEAGKTFDKVFLQNGLLGENIKVLKQKFSQAGIHIKYVPIEKLNRLTRKNHQGICAFLSPIQFFSIEDVVPQLFDEGKMPFILMLDHLTDVRNFGAICRTAEIVGVDAIVIPEEGTAPINSDSIKTSAGAIFNLKICKEKNLLKVLDFLKLSGIKIVCATEKTDKFIYDDELSLPLTIIMGNEERGISKDLLKNADSKLKLPVYGKTESLNVSVACGAFLYEVVRQNLSNNR